MNKTTRSLWLRVLSLVLVALLLPVMNLTVLADDAATVAETTNVAKVGNVEYATIDEAIANWTNGTTLTLLADVTLSDVIKLNSNEYHILDLGTFTMTAASKKDAIQIVNNGRSSASYALDIKADATNPGGITATGKAVVKTTGKTGVKDRPIIRFYGGVFTGTNVVYHSGSNGTNCPQFWFYGGEFNGTVYANRALFQFYGGTFNGNLQISVDSSAYALISGGRFAKLSNLYASALNSGKFTIGSAKGTYDRSIYVDKDGYYVVTSEAITEVSAKYPAVKKETYNSNNYFYYSAAATYGMFYEVASMAGTGDNVTVWEKPAAVVVPDEVVDNAPEEVKEVVEEVVSNVVENEAVNDYVVETPEEVKTFNIELTTVEVESTEEVEAPVATKLTFVVEPKNAEGDKVAAPSEPITFRLPIPASWDCEKVDVKHDGEFLGTYTVEIENGAKYVEITSDAFSEFSVEPAVVLPEYVVLPDGVSVASFGANTVTDGTNYWATLQEAVQAIADAKTENAVLYCKPGADVGSLQHAPVVTTLTIYGNDAFVSGGAERDFDIGNTDPSGGKDITSDITLTVKYLDGCGAWGTKATAHTINLVFENCQNMGKVFLTGTTGILNITMTDCAFEGVIAEAVYSNADGAIALTNVDFSNLNKAINLNHKAGGVQTVVIDGCSFTNCGNDVSADQIPVRVVSSVAGGQTVLTVSDCSFSGTPEGGADILLDYGVGVTEASVSGTAANVTVETAANVGTTTTTTETDVKDFTNVVYNYVAEVNGVQYESLQAAIDAAQAGDVIEIIADVSDETVVVDKNLTITGMAALNNVSISANGATEFTVSGLSFTGNSWINAGTANKLTVSGVTADVTPSNASATNSRSAFISLGRSEQHQLALTVENCNIVSRGGSDPILGWAAITEANLIGNTFGSANAYQTNSDSVKFMSIAQGAIINIVNNTVYSNYNGIVLGQNTTRGNSYTAIFSGNTFLGGADHIWIEVSGSNTYNGNIIVTSDNTINGSAIGVSGIVLHPNLNTFTGYAGIDVVLNNEGKVVGGVVKFAAEGTIADGYELDDNGNVVEAKNYVASINGVNYNTFEEALVAAKSMSGDVVVEILDKVTLNVALSGSFDSITFVGKTETAEIYLDVQGYITATGKKVAFEDLILSKAEGGYVADAGFMNLAFGIFDVVEVTYTDCTFANGAFASSGKVNFIGCTFYRSYDRYGMWAYGNADILVDGCTFADIRGIKMYSEGMERTGNLTVKGTDFSAAGQKPAIVLTSGASVTLDDTNTYSSKGVFELDLDGVPNGTIVNVPATITCVNDNGACGVIVDGKIYTTVAQAAEVATSGSTVTLLHNSNETVELAVGVVIDKNGYTADGVTVRVPYVAEVNGVKYDSLQAAFKAATSGCTIEILADVVVDYYWDARNTGAKFTVPVTIDGNGHTITFTNTVYDGGNHFAAFRFEADATVMDLTVDMTNAISGFAGRFRAISAKANLTVDGCTFIGNGSANNTRAIIFGEGAGANTANLVISVTNSSFEGWRQGVSDNENAQDAKSVTITGNTFEDAGVNVSATDSVVFTGNTVSGLYVKIKSYSAENKLVVTATGNTLTANADDTTNRNYIFAKDVDAQEDFIVEIYFKATAMIGDKGFATVAEAVEYAKANGITDLVITLVGETTRDSAAALEDAFDLCYVTAFDSVTIKQEDNTTPYYIDCIYTGSRNNGGEFIFDGVNIVVVGQYMFEGNVKLINNSVVKSVAEANCFLYYSKTTVEAGSKLYGVIDDLRGGTLIVDGGRDDGEYNTTPDVQDAILVIRWSGDSVTLNNGAYVKVNAANEVGRVTVATGTSLNVYNAKFEACQYIENNGTINLNTEGVITTAKLYGAGVINIDATNLEGRVTVIESKDLASFTGTITITGNEFAKYEITENGLEVVYVEPVVQIGDVKYGTLDEAIEAAVAGDEIVLLKDITITADTTLPAGITLNGNGKSITGATVWAEGNLTFVGHTKMTMFNAGYNKPVITIGEGACLELTGTGRMVLGHGATFNITGTITDAKTADVAELTPSLIAAGASFTGAGLNFNVTNAYVKFTAYCSSKNSSANGMFNFNVTNSIWSQSNTLVFSEPTNGKDPTINFNLKDSVLTSTSHLVFSVTKGEIVIDNSNVNVGNYKQLENRSNMTIKNGSVVYAAFATSSNAKNPGTLTVDNATLISSGEFSGADVGIGTLNVKNNANVTVGKISKANVTVDVTSLLTVTNNIAADTTSVKVDATAFDGEDVLVIKSANLANYTAIELVGCDTAALVLDANGVTVVRAVAKIGDQIFTSLKAAVEAVEDGDTIVLLTDEIITEATRTHNSGSWYDGIYYVGDKSFTIDLNGFTITHDGSVNDYLLNFKNVGTKANTITIKNGTVDAGTAAFCAICTSSVQENQLTINIENLNVINNISNGSTIKVRGGVILNVKDGTTITGKNSYLGIECIASTVNIYDGAEIYMNGATSYNGCLVGVGSGGTVNVYGGYGKGVKGGFIAMTSGGTINISGGEWIANTDGTVGNNSNYYVLTAQSNKYEGGFVGASIINVTGGTLRGGMDAWVLNNIEGEQAEINISGGNFNVNPARFVVDGYEEVENADGTYDVKVERWNIEYTNVYLTENFTMAFAFAKDSEESWNGYYAVITKGDDEANTLVVPYAEWDVVSIGATNDHFAIYYKGIVAKEMNEVVTITIFDADGNQVSNTESESIKSYAMGMFDYTTEAKLKTLVVDILNYGAEAQLYFNYSIDTLANSELTDEHQAYASAAREYVEIGDTSCADGYAFNFFTNVVLDNNIQIMFAFQNLNSVEFSEDAKIVISYNDHDGNLVKNELAISEAQIEGSFIIVTVDSFSALDSSALVTCELVEGETVIASVSDSVEGYVARITDESMIKVGTAMMKYCDSAYAYFYGAK